MEKKEYFKKISLESQRPDVATDTNSRNQSFDHTRDTGSVPKATTINLKRPKSTSVLRSSFGSTMPFHLDYYQNSEKVPNFYNRPAPGSYSVEKKIRTGRKSVVSKFTNAPLYSINHD